jgi:hypothetical protein
MLKKLQKLKQARDNNPNRPRRGAPNKKRVNTLDLTGGIDFEKSKITERLHESKTLLHEVTPDDFDTYQNYQAPFRKEFLSSFSKQDRKSNKTHTYTMIRTNLDKMLFSSEIKEIEDYIKKHISPKAFHRIASFLRLHGEILKDKEYLSCYSPDVDTSNSRLSQAFQTLELNGNTGMAPSWVRTFYKSKCDRIHKQAEETKETKENGEADAEEAAGKDTPDLGKIVEMRQDLIDKATQAYQTIMCVYIKQILNEASPTDE